MNVPGERGAKKINWFLPFSKKSMMIALGPRILERDEGRGREGMGNEDCGSMRKRRVGFFYVWFYIEPKRRSFDDSNFKIGKKI